jgi:predicted amidohydrolase
MRAFTVAAVQIAPLPGPLTAGSVAANCAKGADWLRRCVSATGADLVVLPETASTGFITGISAEELWDVVSEVPGPVTEPIQAAARDLGVHVVWGTYERGARRGVVHNAAVLIGPSGDVLGVYRKTHPFAGERCDQGGWVTAGDEVCVVDTELGRIGMIICFDGDYPELSRITAVRGRRAHREAVRPAAQRDLWELPTGPVPTTTTSMSWAPTPPGSTPAARSTSATRWS